MRLNIKDLFRPTTHEGAPAAIISDEQALRRSVLACMLWEREFYEDGVEIAQRILNLAGKVAPEKVAALALEARNEQHLRHAPLMLLSALSRHAGGKLVEDAIAETVQRADELAELLAVHAAVNGVPPSAVKKKISAAMKRGLARAFQRFDEYALAKYDRAGPVKLRDALFLCHAKPKDEAQAALWKRLVDRELKTPDTWEVSLSGGANKRETFERLIREEKLGYLALLRNLRNMVEAGCDLDLVRGALVARKGAQRVLPFRYIAAARAAPKLEEAIDTAMLAALAQAEKLPGKTIVVIDVSGSMRARLSARSDMTRMTAACALGAICREVCETAVIFATAGNDGTRVHQTQEVPARRGVALVDAIEAMCLPLGGGGIFLKQVMDYVFAQEKTADRVIVITDEQDCGIGKGDEPARANAFGQRNYLINVASAKNGVGYGKWLHIDGFSENVIRYILEMERGEA